MSLGGWPVVATSLPGAGTLAILLAGAIVLVAALVLLMRRRAEALPLLTIFALPFRIPIATDARTVNLLVPLYLVVAAGTLAHLLPRLLAGRGAQSGHEAAGPSESAQPVERRSDPWPRRLQWLLLASVLLYAVQSAYSDDHTKALENVAFFYLPFGLLFMLLRQVEWTPELLLRCLVVAVVLAALFAAVGFVEYANKSLLLNPKVVAANQYDNYFRVNSVFFDPSIYGRFLALVMIAVTTVVLWGRRREVLLGAGVLVWLLAALVTSFSQSSIVALLLGLAVLSAMRWGVRITAYCTVVLAVLALAVLLLAPAGWHFGLKGSGGSAGNATSGRASLVEAGLDLFAERPIQGYGSGSFETEYKRHASASKANAENATSASHAIPVTVAAEQGVIGLALYLALLTSALLVLFRGAGRSPARIAVAGCFAALVLHTWTYADFLEDPFTWALLGIGVALAGAGPRALVRPEPRSSF
jgi:O-antigen ligase